MDLLTTWRLISPVISLLWTLSLIQLKSNVEKVLEISGWGFQMWIGMGFLGHGRGFGLMDFGSP